ncbi:serine/threonine protein phosphatase [Pseudomonas putida]|uniref:metallophosphoesterase n=1 Tax=Pseudomonas putida TaxID=303 RepID=UPI000A119A69|nr:metallophosphoesterase [Pseudomonas putida]ORL69511.1 serine/threonine protein phosphatase [Pseudomonas putida]
MLENIEVLRIKRFAANTAGRDFAVGDIHGHFTRLQAALDAAGFDPAVDRLFSVGDLVDRGPESLSAMEWLDRSWFHAIRGNHEEMTVSSFREGSTDLHFSNGGAWFYALSLDERADVVVALEALPLAVEVETAHGIVGIVHADVPYGRWPDFKLSIETGSPAEAEHVQAIAQWSRSRINSGDTDPVTGISAVVVGHTPLRQPALLGNVYHIDTAGWMDGHFTLLDLATLQCTPPINPKITHDWD